MRSYSRISGSTSLDTLTCTSGSASRSAAATAASCSGCANANRSPTATASASSARTASINCDEARSFNCTEDALGAAALRHLVDPLVGHQGRGVVGVEAVEVGAGLAPQLQDVAEALGGDQAGAGALALQQGVGADGHPVREAARRRRG